MKETSELKKITSKRGKLATTQHVNQLISTYKKERWVHNTGRIGKNDSLSTWYGLEELFSFLELAREHEADGIKMYYGVYPGDYSHIPEFQDRQTIVLVATRQSKTDNGTINKDIYFQKNGSPEILAFNFGTLCPPFCPPSLSSGDTKLGIDLEKTGLTVIEDKDGLHII